MKWTLMLELVDMDSNLRSTLAGFKDPVAPEAEGLFACHRMAPRIMVACPKIHGSPARKNPPRNAKHLGVPPIERST